MDYYQGLFFVFFLHRPSFSEPIQALLSTLQLRYWCRTTKTWHTTNLPVALLLNMLCTWWTVSTTTVVTSANWPFTPASPSSSDCDMARYNVVYGYTSHYSKLECAQEMFNRTQLLNSYIIKRQWTTELTNRASRNSANICVGVLSVSSIITHTHSATTLTHNNGLRNTVRFQQQYISSTLALEKTHSYASQHGVSQVTWSVSEHLAIVARHSCNTRYYTGILTSWHTLFPKIM